MKWLTQLHVNKIYLQCCSQFLKNSSGNNFRLRRVVKILVVPYTPPSSSGNILYDHSTSIKTKKLALLTEQLYTDFT